MHALLVPVPQPRTDLLGRPPLFRMLHGVEQQAELLAELPERLEPVVAAVLVAVAHEESVEEGVDVVELGEVFRGRGEERGRGEGGRRRGRGEGRGGHGCGDWW